MSYGEEVLGAVVGCPHENSDRAIRETFTKKVCKLDFKNIGKL